MSKKVIILRAVPAAGKSTWVEDFLRKNPTGWCRVNRDDIRKMTINKYHSPDMEPLWSDIQNSMIESALKRGINVIVDNTNLAAKYVNGIRKIAEKVGDVEVIEKYFDISLREAIKRDSLREKKVGADVVKRFYDKYINKNLVISDPIYYPKVNRVGNKVVQDESLPKAIICDVDGTLAKMVSRGPFEWDKVDEDIVNEPVAEIVRKFYKDGVKVLITTAREGQARGKTEKWLIDNNIPYTDLFIKPKYDNRKDSVNKTEIYEKNIKGKYNVLFVLDDRNQVVDLWRSLGLTCLQVDYGDF